MEISSHWRLKKERYNLVGSCCPFCGKKSFPPRKICDLCGSDAEKQSKEQEPLTFAETLFYKAVQKIAARRK